MKLSRIALILALFVSCTTGKKPDEKAFLEDGGSTEGGSSTVSDELIADILQQIPSPLEISVLLKESGKTYNADLLNDPDNLHHYNTNYKKALNMGIYGTDLGYTNIYEQNQDGIKYIVTIENLANDLNIGQFFDVKTIGRLATNSKNIDSLLLITTQNFNDINSYLQNQSRSNLSVLLLIGGWLEAMHITCDVAANDPTNKDLQEKIGEQKIILETVLNLLSFYKGSNENMASLLSDFDDLKKAYDKVEINYTYKPSSFEVVNGVMVIKDNSTTTITINDSDVNAIRRIVTNVRSKVIS
jgi:hypothetical protein